MITLIRPQIVTKAIEIVFIGPLYCNVFIMSHFCAVAKFGYVVVKFYQFLRKYSYKNETVITVSYLNVQLFNKIYFRLDNS